MATEAHGNTRKKTGSMFVQNTEFAVKTQSAQGNSSTKSMKRSCAPCVFAGSRIHYRGRRNWYLSVYFRVLPWP